MHNLGQLAREAVGVDVAAFVEVLDCGVKQELNGAVAVVAEIVLARGRQVERGRDAVHRHCEELSQPVLHFVFEAVGAADCGES